MAQHLDFTIPGSLPRPIYPSHVFGLEEVPEHLLPIKIYSSAGHVKSSDAILSADSTTIVFTRASASGPGPSVIADFGVAIAGVPFMQVASIGAPSGSVVVDFAASEGCPGITKAEGDSPYAFSAGADTSRKARLWLNTRNSMKPKCSREPVVNEAHPQLARAMIRGYLKSWFHPDHI
ncbi:Fc.00g005110.m01.CDS01 [Cosmosporella sp. VM-42]